MATAATITEADILAEVIVPDEPTFPVEAAKSVLQWRFSEKARRRIEDLVALNSRGEIAIEDRLELEKYLRVGQVLDLLHAKARISLKHHGVDA